MFTTSQNAVEGEVIAVILARGGSKRLPRKNVRACGGRPLIAWSIAAAQAASSISRVVLSSDDDEILQVARAEGCETMKRPAEFAADDSTSVSAIFHVLDSIGSSSSHVVLLQPTSPLRTAADIDACVSECLEGGAPACVSVRELPRMPASAFVLGPKRSLVAQSTAREGADSAELPDVYVLNGAVYSARVEWLRRTGTFVADGTRAYVMPEERSVDIDYERDFDLADFLLKKSHIV